MALSILDGNQTATTLSTILTGGAHIPEHTIVSFGSQAITDISGAVSGSVVSVPNIDFAAANNDVRPNKAVQLGFYELAGSGDFRVVNNDDAAFPVQVLSGTVTASASNLPVYNPGDTIFDNGLVGVTGKVFVGNDYDGNDGEILIGKPAQEFIGGQGRVGVELINKSGVSLVVTGPALNTWVSNTVTANVAGTINANIRDGSGNNLTSTLIGGVQRLNVSLASAATAGGTLPTFINIHGGTDGSVARTVLLDSSGRTVVTVPNLPASTVTVSALPSGALTTRFGSVTTANTAQLTAAVTNSARRYLLAQNISAGTVTIGIGFSPTTTQGIQLTAGGGLTFDTFCPTGAVFWLGAVTGAAFTILEN